MANTSTPGDFEEAYEGVPPWDIGRPQSAIVRAFEGKRIRGSVLDVGCGRGDNALFLSQGGCYVWGIDIVESAVETAKVRARDLGVDARFFTLDAFKVDALDRRFDTVLDSGLFHALDPAMRDAYLDQIARVLHPGGRLVMLAFSDLEPGDWGPHRISEAELRAAFARGWTLLSIEPARFELAYEPGFAHAWLSVASPTGPI